MSPSAALPKSVDAPRQRSGTVYSIPWQFAFAIISALHDSELRSYAMQPSAEDMQLNSPSINAGQSFLILPSVL